jgi:ABC-2 type transport system ATP-binding protein
VSGLRTFGLTKTYGTTEALRGVDLDIPAGAIYGLVGPNGSGKTTTLELLVGLRHPSAGRIELGVPQDAVAYCPDVPEFEPWLTAAEVLDVSAGLIGRTRSQSDLEELLERVGLGEAAHRRVGGFSRGMRSRLGLAAGLVCEPKLLIADEPAAALDPAGQWEILDLLAGLAGSVTVIISSHDLADVQRICDDIGILAKGQLVYQGALTNLLAMAAPTLRLVVRPPATRLLTDLAAEPWVRAVAEEEPGVIIIDVADVDAAEMRLPDVLAKTGARLVEVGRSGVSLRDIFFKLTGTGPFRRQDAEKH